MPAAGEVSLFAVQLVFEIFGALDGQAGFALGDNRQMNGTTDRSHGLEGAFPVPEAEPRLFGVPETGLAC